MRSVYANLSSFNYYACPVCEAITFFFFSIISGENGNYTDRYAFKCVYIQGKVRSHLIVFELRGEFWRFHRRAEVSKALGPYKTYENKQ